MHKLIAVAIAILALAAAGCGFKPPPPKFKGSLNAAVKVPPGINLRMTTTKDAVNDIFIVGTIGDGARRERFIAGPLPRAQVGGMAARFTPLGFTAIQDVNQDGKVETEISPGFFIYVAGNHGRARSKRVSAAADSTKFLIVAPADPSSLHYVYNVSDEDTGGDEPDGNGSIRRAFVVLTHPFLAYQAGPNPGAVVSVDQNGNFEAPDASTAGPGSAVKAEILKIIRAINTEEFPPQPATSMGAP